MGHISDAVEKYKVTSDKQRMVICSILQGQPTCKSVDVSELSNVQNVPLELSLNVNSEEKSKEESLLNVLKNAVEAIGNKKARLTLQIDIIKE